MQLAENGNDTKLQGHTQLWTSRGARWRGGGGGGGYCAGIPDFFSSSCALGARTITMVIGVD